MNRLAFARQRSDSMTNKADPGDKLKSLTESALALTRAPLDRVPRCRSGTLQMPLELIRANVFTASHVGTARARERSVDVDGAERVYQLHGRVLTQAHADVLMVALGYLSDSGPDARVTVSLDEVNRRLRRKGGALHLDGLWSLLLDLTATTVWFREGRRRTTLGGVLLGASAVDSTVTLWVNDVMLDMMALGTVSVAESKRHTIGNRPLAQWLQLCLAAAPSVTLEAIRLRVAPGQPRDQVRRRVKSAVAELQSSGALPVSFSGDVVSSSS
jgi:hypothetical protein